MNIIIHYIHAGGSALAVIILIYILASKKTTGLAYSDSIKRFGISLLIYSLAGVAEVLGLGTLELPFHLLFLLFLVYTLWYTITKYICPTEEFKAV